MKSSPLHFGVIGTSGIASTHLEELNKLVALGEAKIVAVADLDKKKGKLAAEVYQCDYYQSYLELLKRRDIAVINICVPSGLHSEVTIEAASSGKHVIVEKPMDISLAKAEKMIRECNKAGVTLSVVMQNRFAPAVQQVKSALEQGRLGQPLLINASVNWYRSQSYYDVSSWRGTWAMDGGGAVLNQGIHTVDLVLYLMGQHKEMSGFIATRGHERIEVEDVASCTMKFENGALGVFSSTTCAYPGFYVRIEIFGSNGSVVLEDNQIMQWHIRGEEDSAQGSLQPYPHLSLHGIQFLDVIQSIREGRAPSISGKEGIRSLRFIDELYHLNRHVSDVEIHREGK